MIPKGSALITALLITAIVATVATAIAVHLRITIRETQLAHQFEQTYLDLQGVQYWGMNQVIQNAKLSQQNHSTELYPQTMPATIFQQTQLSGEIADAQALFNINALTNPTAQAQFTRLLKAIDNHISETQANQIAQAITRWLTPSNADSLYLQKNPPYRVSHQLMVSVSELRLVNGISATVYLALLPYITALPSSANEINIFTAPLPILQSLGINMSSAQANSLAACRQRFANTTGLSDIKQTCLLKAGLQIDPNINLILRSNYFLIKGMAELGGQNLILYTLIKRATLQKATTTVFTAKLISQSLNTL